MKFTRPDLNAAVDALQSGRGTREADFARAVGDNFCLDENVSPERVAEFEAFSLAPGNLAREVSEYFDESVQGIERDHTPSTFLPVNEPALMSAGIERVQKIVRVERIDHPMTQAGISFEQVDEAMRGRDMAVLGLLLRRMNEYSGARPAFACFKTEVMADVGDRTNWLPRLRARLGLGHFELNPGEQGHFALMEYGVDEVFHQTDLTRPFAKPTVLESRNSPFFFPAPRGTDEGYAADLAPDLRRNSVREFLHVRLTYEIKHLKLVTRMDGPTEDPHIDHIRQSHMKRLRDNWPDYGSAC